MLAVVDVIVPIFGLIACGWAATFTPLFDERSGNALAGFVFYFAIPLMLFAKVATTQPSAANASSLLVTFYTATFVIYATGGLLARRVFRKRGDEAVLLGFAAAYGNTVMVGIPVVLTVIGPEGAFPLFLIISFHSILFFTLTTVLVEAARGARGGLARVPAEVVRGTVTNPILMALLLGVTWNRLELPLPSTALAFAELAGQAAIPCALFATGAALAGFRIGGTLPVVLTLVLLKGLVHPLLVFFLATQVFDLPTLWTQVAVVLAAMPIGVNPYLFAARYQASEAECATAIAVSTPLAVIVVSVVLLALGLGGS